MESCCVIVIVCHHCGTPTPSCQDSTIFKPRGLSRNKRLVCSDDGRFDDRYEERPLPPPPRPPRHDDRADLPPRPQYDPDLAPRRYEDDPRYDARYDGPPDPRRPAYKGSLLGMCHANIFAGFRVTTRQKCNFLF